MKADDHQEVGNILRRLSQVEDNIGALEGGRKQSANSPEILKVKFFYNGCDFGFDIPTSAAIAALRKEETEIKEKLNSMGVVI